MGIKPVTFWLLLKCLNQLLHCMPPHCMMETAMTGNSVGMMIPTSGRRKQRSKKKSQPEEGKDDSIILKTILRKYLMMMITNSACWTTHHTFVTFLISVSETGRKTLRASSRQMLECRRSRVIAIWGCDVTWKHNKVQSREVQQKETFNSMKNKMYYKIFHFWSWGKKLRKVPYFIITSQYMKTKQISCESAFFFNTEVFGLQLNLLFTVLHLVLYDVANSLTIWLMYKTRTVLGDYILLDYHVYRWCDVPSDTITMTHCRFNL